MYYDNANANARCENMKIQFVIWTNDVIIKISNKRETNIKAKNDVLFSLKGFKTSEKKVEIERQSASYTHLFFIYNII